MIDSPVLFALPSPTVVDPPAAPIRADPTTPLLRADDLGATRGDGVFDALNAVAGAPHALEHHLARLQRSATMLELPAPAVDAYRSAALAALAAHSPTPELMIKLVLTRGVEGADRCTGWVFARPNADFTRERRAGIDLLTLARGYPADIMATAPWLLQGAKTISYALNLATLRYVRARGGDDALFVSSDGWVLEGPNSTLVAKFGDRLVTPPSELGILEGTSQARLFRWAETQGMATAYERIKAADLEAADMLWVCSSGRLAAPVRSLDGVPRSWDVDLHAAALEHLLSAAG